MFCTSSASSSGRTEGKREKVKLRRSDGKMIVTKVVGGVHTHKLMLIPHAPDVDNLISQNCLLLQLIWSKWLQGLLLMPMKFRANLMLSSNNPGSYELVQFQGAHTAKLSWDHTCSWTGTLALYRYNFPFSRITGYPHCKGANHLGGWILTLTNVRLVGMSSHKL